MLTTAVYDIQTKIEKTPGDCLGVFLFKTTKILEDWLGASKIEYINQIIHNYFNY
jgi:hypothetical protein